MMCTKIKSWLKYSMSLKSLGKGLCCFLIGFLGLKAWEAQDYTYFFLTQSFSRPKEYFLVFPKIKPQLNDYTVVHNVWLGQKMVKQIIGTKNSFIWFNHNHECFVDRKRVGGLHRIGVSTGKPKPIEAEVVPEGYVFLYGPHPYSFDSHYEEFGLIPESQLGAKVIRLWTKAI